MQRLVSPMFSLLCSTLLVLTLSCQAQKYGDELSGAWDFSLQAASGGNVPVSFYDRRSSTLIIAGQGLPLRKESMRLVAKLFPQCDVLLFDYRWAGRYGRTLLRGIIQRKCTERLVLDEEEDLRTVLAFVKQLGYTKVIGVCECYSCLLFTKVQADDTHAYGRGPFDYLVLDSPWLSITALFNRFCEDPFLPLHPDVGGAPAWLRSLTARVGFKKMVQTIVAQCARNITICDYLASCDIPVLLVYGLYDLFVPPQDFALVEQAVVASKHATLYTPATHSRNMRFKALYKYAVEQFCEL
jgi:hypothetical protein